MHWMLRSLQTWNVSPSWKMMSAPAAIWALAAYGSGDKELTKNIIRDFAAAGRTAKIDPNFKMMDAMAEQMILAMSDRLWTEATGTRTPMGGLGTFWDDKPKSAGNIDDLL